MRRIFTRFLAVLLLLATLNLAVSAADIFVYRGTIRVKGSLEVAAQLPPVVRTYFIVDYDTGQIALLNYFTKGTRKQTVNNDTVSVIHASLPNARPVTVLSRVEPSATPPGVLHNMLSLRGLDAPLRIETAPGTRDVARPRVLTGIVLSVNGVDGGGGTFGDLLLNLTFNSALTLDANNNNKTVELVRDQISASLVEQGYAL